MQNTTELSAANPGYKDEVRSGELEPVAVR